MTNSFLPPKTEHDDIRIVLFDAQIAWLRWAEEAFTTLSKEDAFTAIDRALKDIQKRKDSYVSAKQTEG